MPIPQMIRRFVLYFFMVATVHAWWTFPGQYDSPEGNLIHLTIALTCSAIVVAMLAIELTVWQFRQALAAKCREQQKLPTET